MEPLSQSMRYLNGIYISFFCYSGKCHRDIGPFSHVIPNKVLELIVPKTLQDSLRTVSHPGYVCNTGILGNVFTVEHFDPIKYIPNGVFLTGFFSNYPTQTAIDNMMELIIKGGISPLYNKVFALKGIVETHKLLEFGGAGGKIILKIT